MKFEIIGKNVSVTNEIRERIEKKLSFLNKYLLIDDDTVAKVVVKNYSNVLKIEVTINTKIGLLRSEVLDNDLFTAIDMSLDKLENQIRKQKTRLSNKHREKLSHSFINEQQEQDNDDQIVKTKKVYAIKMDLEQAILEMNMLDHSFFVFTDEETNKPAICYKRYDGQYGLLEIE